jgi:acyl carrier protein
MEILNDVIYPVIDAEKKHAKHPDAFRKTPETLLLGTAGVLDSLGLVNFIVAVEERLEDEFEISVTLSDKRAFSRSGSPFRTVATLAVYIEESIKETTP